VSPKQDGLRLKREMHNMLRRDADPELARERCSGSGTSTSRPNSNRARRQRRARASCVQCCAECGKQYMPAYMLQQSSELGWWSHSLVKSKRITL